MPFYLMFLGVVALGAAPSRAQEAVASGGCLSPAEIRDAMALRKILEPMAAVKEAVRITRSEPLRSQLCRSKDGLQYELTLLRRDGKVVRLVLNAVSGVVISNRVPPERSGIDRGKPPQTVHARPASPDRSDADASDRAKALTGERDKPADRAKPSDRDASERRAEPSSRPTTPAASRLDVMPAAEHAAEPPPIAPASAH